MTTGRSLIALVLALIIPLYFVLMWVVSTHRRLVVMRDRCKEAFAQFETQLRRREDLSTNPAEFTSLEKELGPARAAYNQCVSAYNSALQTFPARLLAVFCNFPPAVTLGPDES